MSDKQTVLITGATGFLGRHLCDYFARKGDTVRGLARRTDRYPFVEPGITLFSCDLPNVMDRSDFEGVDVVIHCAYATRIMSQAEAYQVNHVGTLKVYEASQQAHVSRFVFISSVGAHADAESYYGKSKYALEQQMDPSKDLIIQPGLILGRGEDGTFNRMKAQLRALGVVPIFDGGHQILQTIHVEDLCHAIDLSIQKKLTGSLVIAEPEGLEMRAFFKALAAQMNTRCLLVSLPMEFTLRVLTMMERFKIPFPLSSENLLGLKGMRHVPSALDLARIGLTVKSARESLALIVGIDADRSTNKEP